MHGLAERLDHLFSSGSSVNKASFLPYSCYGKPVQLCMQVVTQISLLLLLFGTIAGGMAFLADMVRVEWSVGLLHCCWGRCESTFMAVVLNLLFASLLPRQEAKSTCFGCSRDFNTRQNLWLLPQGLKALRLQSKHNLMCACTRTRTCTCVRTLRIPCAEECMPLLHMLSHRAGAWRPCAAKAWMTRTRWSMRQTCMGVGQAYFLGKGWEMTGTFKGEGQPRRHVPCCCTSGEAHCRSWKMTGGLSW